MTTTITPLGDAGIGNGSPLPVVVVSWRSTRDALAVVHEPPGAPSPIVTGRGLTWRQGTITYRLLGLPAARAVEGAHAGRVVLAAEGPAAAIGMVYVATGVAVELAERRASGPDWWDVTVDYREVS